MEINLSNYRVNRFSQWGEDGVIDILFHIMHIDSGLLCEFGAHDGKSWSNTRHHFLKGGFGSLLMESDRTLYEKCVVNCPASTVLNVFVEPEGPTSLNAIFSDRAVTDIALLSIDIDGGDYDVWKSLDKARYKPKVVIIEFENWYDHRALQEFEWSLHKDGYNLACVTGNYIFVRSDFNVKSKHSINYLIDTSGVLDYDLLLERITKDQYAEYVLRKDLEPDLFTKLARPQYITI